MRGSSRGPGLKIFILATRIRIPYSVLWVQFGSNQDDFCWYVKNHTGDNYPSHYVEDGILYGEIS